MTDSWPATDPSFTAGEPRGTGPEDGRWALPGGCLAQPLRSPEQAGLVALPEWAQLGARTDHTSNSTLLFLSRVLKGAEFP